MHKNNRRRSNRPSRRLSTEALECRRLLAVDVQQLANINQTNSWEGVSLLTEINGQAYFMAREPAADHLGVDLWVTDGTQAGTTKLAGPIDPVLNDEFANVGGTFYFEGEDAANGRELWKSDGTPAGTVLVRDFTPGAADSYLNDLVNLNGQLLFSNSGELARSNGTAAGTFRVKDLRAGQSDQVDDITLVGSSTAYFTARHAATGEALYKTDGTVAGTVLVEDAQALSYLENVSGTLFFVKGGGVWKYSGTGATELVKAGGNAQELTNVGGTLFFEAGDGEIWKSDGSAAGTRFLKNSGHAFNLVNMNDRLYFTGGVELNGDGYELWTSNGTDAGTIMVRDIAPGSGYRYEYGHYGHERKGPYGNSSRPDHLTNLNGTVFFLADDLHGNQLWTTDGTEAGTVLVQEGDFTSLLNRNGSLLLAGELPQTEGSNLYNSDGSAGDASLIPRRGPGTGSSNPGAPVEINGTLYLTADDGIHGRELWKVVNGTASLVKDISPGNQDSYITELTNLQGKLYFSCRDDTSAARLWTSDGSSAGTMPVEDSLGGQVFSPGDLTPIGNQLFFTARDMAGFELWKTDGTLAGTMRVKDIFPGERFQGIANYSSPDHLVNFNGKLFFTALTRNGEELWQSDGTEVGTTLVADVFPGERSDGTGRPNSSSPSYLTNFNGALFFAATDAQGRGLWKTDGTAAGTELVKGSAEGLEVKSAIPFAVAGSTLYFAGTDEADGQELWKTDGSAPGTLQVKDIRSGVGGSKIRQLTNVNGTLYFTTIAGGSHSRLWRSDGSEAGTQEVAGAGFEPSNLVNLDGTLFYNADAYTENLGRELLHVTNAGTVEVNDLLPGPAGSNPGSFAIAGGKLYFAATGTKGRELWQALSPAGPPNDAPVLDPAGNPTLVPTAEDTLHPAGTLVASLLTGVTDPDANALSGMAVTGLGGATNGTWQYTLDNGANWLPIGAPSEQAALLLPANLQTKVRFIPNANFNGQVKLYFRAWDQTEGTAGSTFDLIGHYGGRHAFSKAYETATLTVSPVNDAPVLSPIAPSLIPITQDAANPFVTELHDLLGGSITDIDGAGKGIAVTWTGGLDFGSWQYHLGFGDWVAIGPTSSTAARLIPATASLRFVPQPGFHGDIKLFYRAWDRTQGTVGGVLDLTKNLGGRTSISLGYDHATQHVNMAPVLGQSDTAPHAYELNSPGVHFMWGALSGDPTTLTDVDSPDFAQGILRVHTVAGRRIGDRIEASWSFSISGTGAFFNATQIGSVSSNGKDGNDLRIVFNSSATQDLVRRLTNSLRFRTENGIAATRKLEVRVWDGDGGASNTLVRTINAA